jgi:Rrf2 family nitric oxide-sensitive transcriptional repressor
MRLTVYTDYSLRVLMYLALNSERLPTIAEIATTNRVSKNHLMKVVYDLGQAGYVETLRGRNGGLRLGREPEKIGLGDVVRHSEPAMRPPRRSSRCSTATVWLILWPTRTS